MTCEDVPSIPGAFVLSGVLTPDECTQLLRAALAIGFSDDLPLEKQEPTRIGSCEILAEAHTLEPIWQRVRAHLPPTLEGCKLEGINARFRIFAYDEGGVYRPHIDGTWPGSGLDADGRYMHDSYGASVRSRLTFLIYLNEDFTGGETTFYLPGPTRLHAHRVKPQTGAVLCFPQSNTASLLHEGSAVTRGRKYVIRTDVLYRTPERAS